MISQELTEHLQLIQKLLSTLMISYEDFQLRKNRDKELRISLKQHVIYMLCILTAIFIATLTISACFKEAKPFLFPITICQMVLAIVVYVLIMRTFIKNNRMQEDKSGQQNKSAMSIYELDQLRFKILQNLANSPIPPAYMTPTSIKKMLNLVESGVCNSLEECLNTLDKETNKKKHFEELEMMKHLQMISYH